MTRCTYIKVCGFDLFANYVVRDAFPRVKSFSPRKYIMYIIYYMLCRGAFPFEYSSLLYSLATSYRHSRLINGFSENISLSLGTLLRSPSRRQHNLDINARTLRVLSKTTQKAVKKLHPIRIPTSVSGVSRTLGKHKGPHRIAAPSRLMQNTEDI